MSLVRWIALNKSRSEAWIRVVVKSKHFIVVIFGFHLLLVAHVTEFEALWLDVSEQSAHWKSQLKFHITGRVPCPSKPWKMLHLSVRSHCWCRKLINGACTWNQGCPNELSFTTLMLDPDWSVEKHDLTFFPNKQVRGAQTIHRYTMFSCKIISVILTLCSWRINSLKWEAE